MRGPRVFRRSTLLVAVAGALLLTGCATLGVLETIDSLMRQGRELYAAGRYDEAIGKFQEVLKRDAKYWSAYLELARTHIARRSWADAITNGRKAFELAPSGENVVTVFGEALVGGGLDALGRRQFSEATGHLTEYVRLRPTDAQGYLHLGRAYLESGAYAPALQAVLDGLGQGGGGAARGELVQTLLDGGRRALAQRDYASAIGFLREYVAVDPQSVSAFLDLGKAYWQSGETGNALGAFRRVLQLSPGHSEALRFLRGGD